MDIPWRLILRGKSSRWIKRYLRVCRKNIFPRDLDSILRIWLALWSRRMKGPNNFKLDLRSSRESGYESYPESPFLRMLRRGRSRNIPAISWDFIVHVSLFHRRFHFIIHGGEMTEMRDASATWSRSKRISKTRLRVIVRESVSPLPYARCWIYSIIESVDIARIFTEL